MKPLRSNSARKRDDNFDYQNLEPRQMLSGNVPAVDAQVELARSFLGATLETQYLVQGNSDVQFIKAKQPFRAEIEAAGGVFAEGNVSFDQASYSLGDVVTVTLGEGNQLRRKRHCDCA